MLFVWDWQPTVDTAFGAKEKTRTYAQKATDSAGLLSQKQSAFRADGTRNKLWVFTAIFSVALLIMDIAVLVCMEFFELDDVPLRLQDLFEALWFFRWFFLLVLPSHIARIEAIVNENFLSVSIAQVRLGRLGLIIALLAHLASCVWAAVGWYGLENDADSWVDHDRVIREEVLAGTSAALIAWLRGFYYAASTYMVIVIGDVTPRTMNETGYTLVLVLLGASVNSSILGLIVSVVANVDKEKHEQALG
ncbi:hypothetical protein AB1Y20_000809 [Prymnesium parvum]|uniref:Ion transport domain-containing protein n=1 Tax=Prymnesium parvum TaxID=97485 RepID=A0AB34K7R3_PRYPA